MNDHPTDYVVLHRMSKIGSFTISNTLRAAAPHLKIDQIHFLTPHGINRARHEMRMPDVRDEVVEMLGKQIDTANRCVDEIERRRKAGMPFCVISGYRDPLDQLVSYLFQNLQGWFPEVDVDSPDPPAQAAYIERKLKRQFRQLVLEKQCPATAEDDRFANAFVRGLEWFDREFQPFHGMDVYEHQPDELGTIVLDRAGVRYIVFKQESLRTHFHAILSHVPGVRVGAPIHSNEAEKKKVAGLYRAFRHCFQPTAAMHGFYYQSRYFHHFYRNTAPHFPCPARADVECPVDAVAERVLRVTASELHKARARVAELEAVQPELQQALRIIEQMKATKTWRFHTMLRKLLRVQEG